MTIRVGIIGAGRIGQLAHLQGLAGDPACAVVAIADLRPELARRVADKFAIARVYTDHRALLADNSIDAVFVVTHRYQTAAVVRDALQAKKHVFSEKPMALDSGTARELVSLAERQGVLYAVGYMKRYDPWVALAKANVDQAAGRDPVHLIRISCFGGDTERDDAYLMTDEPRPSADRATFMPEWLPKPLHASYDSFLNVYSHDVDLALYLASSDLALSHAVMLDENCHHVLLRNERLAVSLDTAAIPGKDWRESLDLVSGENLLSVRLPAPLDSQSQGAATFSDPDTRSLAPENNTWAFQSQGAAFIRAVRGETTFRSTGAQALRALELTEDIFRAYVKQAPMESRHVAQ